MKDVVISFKADEDLANMLSTVQNKSLFIRNAVLKAMNNFCPLCAGKGFLLHDDHVDDFLARHTIESCKDCSGIIIGCK